MVPSRVSGRKLAILELAGIEPAYMLPIASFAVAGAVA
jgi:hypothetical protein